MIGSNKARDIVNTLGLGLWLGLPENADLRIRIFWQPQRTFAPWNESSIGWNFRSRERKFHRTFLPWNFRSLELSLPGTFVPFHQLSLSELFLIGLTIVNINVRCRSQVL